MNRLSTNLENNRVLGVENPPSVSGERNQVDTEHDCSPSHITHESQSNEDRFGVAVDDETLAPVASVDRERSQSPSGSEGIQKCGPIHETLAASGKSSSISEVEVDDADLARRGFRKEHHEDAAAKGALCKQFIDLTKNGQISGNQAAAILGKPVNWFSNNVPAYKQLGDAAFLPKYRVAKPAEIAEMTLPKWFIPVARFFYLKTNRDRVTGSVPEAIRRTISLPHLPPGIAKQRIINLVGQIPECPAELREAILARERDGKPMLTPRLMEAISIAAPFVKRHRNKTDSHLDYLSAPGSAMWRNEYSETANNGKGAIKRQFIQAGEVIECDDGTINFPVCIPWTLGGCPCSEQYKVKIGRFQWLRAIDVGSRFRPAYIYVARPRSSYRAEDILCLLRAIARTCGIPQYFRLESGAWAANRVQEAIRLMGSQRWGVYSPHQKPFVETGFGTDWTKLSACFPDAQVGRFMGEEEQTNKLLVACQKGQKDPRRHFPMIHDVLKAMDMITAEENRTPVKSQTYGRWIPEERWQLHTTKNPLRQLDPATDWIFSPYVRERKVTGALVTIMVRLFEDFSVPFSFASEELLHFHGARVKLYFDPTDAQCRATVVLAQTWRGTKEGTVIGTADQINEIAAYARFVMGYTADDQHITERGLGRRQKQIHAGALRREVRAITGPKLTTTEIRDGLGQKAIHEHTTISSPQKDTYQGTSPEEAGSPRTGTSIPLYPALRGDETANTSTRIDERKQDQFEGNAQRETDAIVTPRDRRGSASDQPISIQRQQQADDWERKNALDLT